MLLHMHVVKWRAWSQSIMNKQASFSGQIATATLLLCKSPSPLSTTTSQPSCLLPLPPALSHSFVPTLTTNYSLSHFLRFPHSALSHSIPLTLIYFPRCIFSDVTSVSWDSVVHSPPHGVCPYLCLSPSLPLSVCLPHLLESDRTRAHNELAFSFASLFSLAQPSLESFSQSL